MISGLLAFLFDLLSQVVLQPHLLDGFHLGFNPVDMLIHVLDHIFQHMASRKVPHLSAMHHAVALEREHLLFGLQIRLELFRYRLADMHGIHAL